MFFIFIIIIIIIISLSAAIDLLCIRRLVVIWWWPVFTVVPKFIPDLNSTFGYVCGNAVNIHRNNFPLFERFIFFASFICIWFQTFEQYFVEISWFASSHPDIQCMWHVCFYHWLFVFFFSFTNFFKNAAQFTFTHI